MDNYEFQSEPENSFHENYNLYHDKRSQSFATARFVLGLIAALTPYFVFTSLICGPLAIIFGLLSKGGEMTMDTKGKGCCHSWDHWSCTDSPYHACSFPCCDP